MPLTDKIDQDLKAALKGSDKLRLETLRMLKSALKYRQIEKKASLTPLTDDEVLSVLVTHAKQRRESIEQFRKAGREDLALKEEAELEVLKGYMPRELTAGELDTLIKECVEEAGAKGPADMGKIMRLLMPRLKGAYDGKLAGQRVKETLEAMK